MVTASLTPAARMVLTVAENDPRLPTDWTDARCADMCVKIQDGTHFSPKIGGNDYLYVTSKHIRFGQLDISSAEHISESEHRKIYARCDTKRGDLLLTKDGANTGNAAIHNLDEEISLLSSVAFLRFDSARYEAGYFLQYILSNAGQRRIKEMMSGNAITRLTLQKINNFTIPSPPIAEQRAIAEVLSDVDGLLWALEMLIAKKRAIKKAAMQQLLTGKTRLPGFSDEWTKCVLGEVASVKTGPFGSALHERDYVTDGTPIITVEHLGDLGVLHSNMPMVSDDDRKRLSMYSLTIGDIVFSRVGSIDRNALIRESEKGWLFSGRLLRVRPDASRVSSSYLSHQFHGERFKRLVREVAVGQTMPSLNTRILQNIEVQLPDLAEQEAISILLSDMDADIAALKCRCEKAKAIKQGMMQQLLTGRVRLAQPEAA